MDEITMARAAYDAADAALGDALTALREAVGRHAASLLGPGWIVVGSSSSASATRGRWPGCGRGYPVMLRWVHGVDSWAWAAWAAHEGRDSDRCGAPNPETDAVHASTPAGALLALADLADGMAARGRLPRRVADLRHLAQYCRDLAAECPEVNDGA